MKGALLNKIQRSVRLKVLLRRMLTVDTQLEMSMTRDNARCCVSKEEDVEFRNVDEREPGDDKSFS